MKVIDTVNKTELDLTAEELVDLVANHNRQVDLIFAEPRTDEDGYLKWDHENWTCVDGKRFVRSYFLQGRALSDYSGYNKYDLASYFLPQEAQEVRPGSTPPRSPILLLKLPAAAPSFAWSGRCAVIHERLCPVFVNWAEPFSTYS